MNQTHLQEEPEKFQSLDKISSLTGSIKKPQFTERKRHQNSFLSTYSQCPELAISYANERDGLGRLIGQS